MKFLGQIPLFLALILPLGAFAQQPDLPRTKQHEVQAHADADRLTADLDQLMLRFEEAVDLEDQESIDAMLPDLRQLMDRAIAAQQAKLEGLAARAKEEGETGNPQLIDAQQTLVEQQKIARAFDEGNVSFFTEEKKKGTGMLMLQAFKDTL